MAHAIITLTSDFGLRDPYVAEMKAVILSISSNATIVDVAHEIEKFNIRMGAYVLASAAPYFPKGAIHIAVVDPSVGTKRRPLLIQTRQAFYVGPDNGVLVLAAQKQGIEHIYEITNRNFMLPKVSTTFHGRDIFAPVAAHLANGISPKEFGPEIQKIVTPKFANVTKRKEGLVGEVIHVDDFGNIVTNFGEKELSSVSAKGYVNIKLGNTQLKLKICKAYAEAEPQELLAIIGSHDFLEISLNQGNAAKNLRVKSGDKIILCRS